MAILAINGGTKDGVQSITPGCGVRRSKALNSTLSELRWSITTSLRLMDDGYDRRNARG